MEEASLRPIPPPHDEDDEDVHWALSTATALWGRGEREEALRWLRRAAEQASDANADLRALELFKAAAEVAQTISASDAAPTAVEAGAGAPPAPSSRPPKSPASAPPQPSSARPATPAATSTPPPKPSAPPPKPGAPPPPPPPGAKPSRPPGAGADSARAERGGATPSTPPPVKTTSAIRSPAGGATPGAAAAAPAARDAGAPKPTASAIRASAQAAPGQAAPGRAAAPAPAPVPAKPAPVRGAASTPQPPAVRPAGAAPALPGRAAGGASPAGDPPAGAASPAGAQSRAALTKGRTIIGFAGASHERVSSATAVTQEVPAVKIPAASKPSGQVPGKDAAPERASAEPPASDPEPPADQRETVPTNISVTLARRQARPLGAASQDETERRERSWHETSDEEGTMRRTLSERERRMLLEHRTEDPDEATPLLSLEEQRAQESASAAAARPDVPMEADPRDDGASWTDAEPADDDGASADVEGERTLARDVPGAKPGKGAEGAASWSRGEAQEGRGNSPSELSWSDPPYEGAGAWQAPPPRLPAAQIEPLPALRMAVIGISSAGELRLVPMDGRNAPPRGAALGILVPMTPGDGETIARLLQLRSS
ncbi:hypothetical protein [Sorangium sp. So ce131]|uniref:hypothetical protein n=1 Tax=Sorangium sp. So ce131 TaxID=3133282 RepID=UPI003F637D6D